MQVVTKRRRGTTESPPSAGPGPQMGQDQMKTYLRSLISDLTEYLGDGLALELYLVLDLSPGEMKGRIADLLRDAVSHLAWGGVVCYAALRQLQSVISKNTDWFPTDPVKRARDAVDLLLHDSKICWIANKRLHFYRNHRERQGAAARVLNLARTKVVETLGELTEDKYLRCLELAGFGPGAPYLDTWEWPDSSSIVCKIAGDQTATKRALPHFLCASALNDGWISHLVRMGACLKIVKCDRVTTVDKTADKDRSIAQQPSLNVYLQKGVGRVMGELLVKVGILLRSQARNHEAARKGSLDGKTATVDLKSASNRNCIELIRWLFPSTWYTLLDDLRCPMGLVPGKRTPIQYGMFSTMGNATTFPIQCMVFYSIAWASCRISGEDVSAIRVYGDDIVVPVGALALMMETLRFAGHEVNVDKTHAFGPFRESCGKDYVQGLDVRPVYLLKCPESDMERMSAYNRLMLGAIMPLPRLTAAIKLGARRCLVGPPDLGASPAKALTFLTGSQKRRKLGIVTRETAMQEPALDVNAYFIEDPPMHTGVCSSYQSRYWLVSGYHEVPAVLDFEVCPETKWMAILYGMRLFRNTQGATLDDLVVPSSTVLRTHVSEKFVLKWSNVDAVKRCLYYART